MTQAERERLKRECTDRAMAMLRAAQEKGELTIAEVELYGALVHIFAADINKTGTLLDHFLCLSNGGIQTSILTAIRKGIRCDIEDTHNPRYAQVDDGTSAVQLIIHTNPIKKSR